MTCAAHALAESRGFLLAGDVDMIRWCVRQLPSPPVVIDLGVGSGTTALAVFAECPTAVVVSYDINRTNLYWSQEAIARAEHLDTWAGYGVDSLTAATGHADGSVDLIMLDTSHEYEETAAALAAWIPKLKLDGLLWAHDYVGEYDGCRRAIDESVEAGIASVLLPPVVGLGIVLCHPSALTTHRGAATLAIEDGGLDATVHDDDDAG